MISEQAFIWVYLPGQTEPVVAGVIAWIRGEYQFRYARSYQRRPDAIPLSIPGCPLGEINDDVVFIRNELTGVIRDASPDAWGRNVMLREAADRGEGDLGEIDFLLRAGPDRIGAMDVTDSPHEYVPKESQAAPLEDLLEAADRVDQGKPLDPYLDAALNHGTSVGGARPKALLHENGEYWIAKFSSTKDHLDMVSIEAGAMRLAEIAGLDVAEHQVVTALNKKSILVKRFDREVEGGQVLRRHMISALTMLNMDEYDVRAGFASYLRMTDVLRQLATDFSRDGRELFARMVFNILIGNTDDHARNHACFWDGSFLDLTPAYDICPQPRLGYSADQAMVVGDQGRKASLANALSACERFGLDQAEALDIVRDLEACVRLKWREVFEDSGVPEGDLKYLSQSTMVSESIYEGSDHLFL